MDDLISRQKLLKDIEQYHLSDGKFQHWVEVQPSADVQPARHGHWQITDAYPHNIYCSECHTRFAQTHWAVWEDGSLPREFCPNCGARMDGEQNETD